ncbi:non-heme ferritin [Candidatus Pantoea carbekii]|uniref:Ferritin n=1 Tax=Candidatus Pantoea carbekii TaxID=1235990 RepID=U3U2E4_9GAMM|nr:non-heme ferritin [Candidatus Pantoea carbekii]AKC32555.1 ferritin-1 FtnA [Candidatus Pantoea carbekii]BAO00286.1 FtnA protein [Candidatus Pantoea carbekii]
MLSIEMTSLLNNQMNLEFFSSNLYLQMSAWCSSKGFEGTGSFLKMHAREEMEHMQRLFDYLSDTGALPIIGNIAAPPFNWNSLREVLGEALEHEKFITNKINDLINCAVSTQDYSTFNLLQWYVSEQRKEEKLFKTVLDKLKLVGNKGEGLFLIDKELGRMREI